MVATVVDRLHGEFASLISVLDQAGEVSLRSTADENLRKALLMAAASHFEHRMTDAVLSFFSEVANGHSLATSFVRNRAISRQYHTWFNWDRRNANSFFGMFGDEFREFMKTMIEEDGELRDSVRAFLEIGDNRNRLVHQDFGSLFLEKTSQEIYDLYTKSLVFVETFPRALRECGLAPAEQQDAVAGEP